MTDEKKPVIVTVADIRGIAYCSRGSRRFFAQAGLNWTEFLKHGVESTILEKIDDEMVRAAIAQARRRTETDTS
jgi:hypothetical protein